MRVLAGLCSLVFAGIGLFWGGVLMIALIVTPIDRPEPVPASTIIALGFFAIAFLLAAVTSAGYVRVPTQAKARTAIVTGAIVTGAIASVPLLIWFPIVAAPTI